MFLFKGWTPAFVRLAPNTVLLFVFFAVRFAHSFDNNFLADDSYCDSNSRMVGLHSRSPRSWTPSVHTCTSTWSWWFRKQISPGVPSHSTTPKLDNYILWALLDLRITAHLELRSFNHTLQQLPPEFPVLQRAFTNALLGTKCTSLTRWRIKQTCRLFARWTQLLGCHVPAEEFQKAKRTGSTEWGRSPDKKICSNPIPVFTPTGKS